MNNFDNSEVYSLDKSSAFMVFYTPGPEWKEGNSVYEQDLKAHGEYMKRYLDSGKLIMGGPFKNDTGGMALLQNMNYDQVKDFVRDDPGVQNGVFIAKIYPWHVAFSSSN